MNISAFICENWIPVLAVCIILFIIVISLASVKSSEERKLEQRVRDLTYEIEQLRKENMELKKTKERPSEDIKTLKRVMITGKSIKE